MGQSADIELSHAVRAVRRGDIRIEFNQQGGIDVFGDVAINVFSTIGRHEDLDNIPQSIYIGTSPDTKTALYMRQEDEVGLMTWEGVHLHAGELNLSLHRQRLLDYSVALRMPTAREMEFILNKGDIEGVQALSPDKSYWVHDLNDIDGPFGTTRRPNGSSQNDFKSSLNAVRLVYTQPR